MSDLDKLREVGRNLLDPELAMVMVDQAVPAIVVVRDDLTIFFLNQAAEVMTGYHRTELWGKHVNVLVPEELREKHSAHVAEYMRDPKKRTMGLGLTGLSVNLDIKLLTKSGQVVSVETSLNPVVSEQGRFVVVTIRRRLDV